MVQIPQGVEDPVRFTGAPEDVCDDGVPLQTQLLLRTVLRQRQRASVPEMGTLALSKGCYFLQGASHQEDSRMDRPVSSHPYHTCPSSHSNNQSCHRARKHPEERGTNPGRRGEQTHGDTPCATLSHGIVQYRCCALYYRDGLM